MPPNAGWCAAAKDHNAAVCRNDGASFEQVPYPSAVIDAPVGDVDVSSGGVQDFEVFLVVEVSGLAIPVAVVFGGVVEVEFIQDHTAAEALVGHAVAIVVVGVAVQNIAIVQDAVAIAIAHVGFARIANTVAVTVELVTV